MTHFKKTTQDKDPGTPAGEVQRPQNSGSTRHNHHSRSEIHNDFMTEENKATVKVRLTDEMTAASPTVVRLHVLL